MKLSEARRAEGLTQEALASELGLAGGKGSLSAIETGAEKPSLELALRIQLRFRGEVRAAELRPDLADLIKATLDADADLLANHRRLSALPQRQLEPEGCEA